MAGLLAQIVFEDKMRKRYSALDEETPPTFAIAAKRLM
jgi:hypothetical protein